jgi:transposase
MKLMGRPPSYPKELRDRAVRLVLETKAEYPTEFAAIVSIAGKLGIGSPQIKALKRENAELRRANEILKSASAFFAAELDRPHRF